MDSFSYNGFSDVNMYAYAYGKRWAKVQAISCVCQREMTPVYAMGEEEPYAKHKYHYNGILILDEIYGLKPASSFDFLVLIARNDKTGETQEMCLIDVVFLEEGLEVPAKVGEQIVFVAKRQNPWHPIES